MRELVSRAPRYAVRLAIRYRFGSRGKWQEGTTHNVSASGVLFECDSSDPRLTFNKRIQMKLLMPAEIVGSVPSGVVCAGRVARIVPSGQDRAQVAATIDRYRLTRIASPKNP